MSKHTTMLPLGMYWAGPEWAYNTDFWKEASEQERRWLLDASATAMAKLYIGYDAASNAALQEAADHGVTVYEPDADLMASIEAFKMESVAQAYALAKERYNLENGQQLIDRFRATVDKWQDLLTGVDRSNAEVIAALLKSEIFDKVDVATYGLN